MFLFTLRTYRQANSLLLQNSSLREREQTILMRFLNKAVMHRTIFFQSQSRDSSQQFTVRTKLLRLRLIDSYRNAKAE